MIFIPQSPIDNPVELSVNQTITENPTLVYAAVFFGRKCFLNLSVKGFSSPAISSNIASMEIIKRNGNSETYDRKKIERAIGKAFESTKRAIGEEELSRLARIVEEKVINDGRLEVEYVQDKVEETLMENGFYQEAKAYILFRSKRSKLREERKALIKALGDEGIEEVLVKIQKDYLEEKYSLNTLKEKYESFVKEEMGIDEKLDAITKAAVELTRSESPKWDYIAARFLAYSFSKELNKTEEELNISGLYEKLRYLTDEGLYGAYILQSYGKKEIEEAEKFIDDSRLDKFTYSGLDLLLKRYIIRSHNHVALESPEEMFLGIALHLAMNEKKEKRMEFVKDFYDMLSKMEVTMATPTMANARKPYHQLSSCFIDTVPDSLNGIYRSIDNFAKVSKFGGGMGMYFGKVRANGSAIRGFEGAAGGVIRWIRLVNDTAVAVDQLGVRSGAVAVYLDVWHKDLPEFLNLRTNNGDDRMKAHDVFPAVCYPDYFWHLAKEDIDAPWYMMCPHQIWSIKGYHLEDFYGEEWERKYLECVNDKRIQMRVMSVKEIIRLVLKSAVETGTPFTFNRDAVNRMNPNGHMGMIYSSNLCTEIAQNMSQIEEVSIETKTVDGDTVMVTTTRPGDFVVCNLASLSLGNIDTGDKAHLRHVVRSVTRALDNVIDLNFYPLEYAKYTTKRYRAIGLGISGYHHMLAKNAIKWESREHVDFVDALFEDISYFAIEASADLAIEKERYELFPGSDWENGSFFEKRNYESPRWNDLKRKIKETGIRNGYLLAIAPTSSTSIIAGTSAGVDPVMKRFFYEEKKGAMLPRIAPEPSEKTWWYYKNAHEIDQKWSIKAAAARQRHIDQAQSMNLYITNDYTMRQVLELYILAWELGVKTIYYIRSKSLEVDECESCSS